jgi:hypothetical protein
MEFRVAAVCTVDYSSVPAVSGNLKEYYLSRIISSKMFAQDKQTCCFTQQSRQYDDLIQFNLLASKARVDVDELRSNWLISNVVLKKTSPDYSPK